MNLSRKIVLLIVSTFIALIFIVAVLTDVILLSNYRQLEEKSIINHVQLVYNHIRNRLDQVDVTARDFAVGIGGQLQKGKGLAGLTRRYFSESNLHLHKVDLAAVYDVEGRRFDMQRIDCETGTSCSIPESLRFSVQSLIGAIRDSAGMPINGVVDAGGAPFMVSLKPLKAADGTVRGYLVVGCFLDKEELDGIAKVTGVSATLIPIVSDTPAPEDSRAIAELARSGTFVAKIQDSTHISGYASLKDIHGNPLYLVKISDERILFQQGKTSYYYILIALVVCGAAFCAVTLLFIRVAVLKRLATLSATVGEISRKGDISSRLETSGEDELEHLAGSINSMLDSLESAEQSLKESEERYRALFERAPDGILIIGMDDEEAGVIVAANRAAAEQHGYTVEEIRGMKVSDLNTPEANAKAIEIIREISAGAWITHEAWHVKKDGTHFPIEVHAGPFRVKGRNYVLGFDRDITSRKLAEETDRINMEQISDLIAELGRQAVDLELANRELETFNYSVSHDMRGPLTRISGYCQLLLEDDSGVCPQTRTYLSRIYESSIWLDEMIDAMLKLVQMARADFMPEPVNLTEICREQLNGLLQAEPDRIVEAVLAPDVTVLGDKSLLKILMANLLNNAWKYCSRVGQVRIEFGVLSDAPSPVYFVRDNGTGFDMRDAGKLFRVFSRLHDPTQFSGNGIGLATAQRIIIRHGGRIWAEGEAGRGATFFFTLERDVRPV
jgi:PAS domain S-box-containing protein